MRAQPPSWRVGRALWRLSRDRWLAGPEVSRLGLALAACLSDRPAAVLRGTRVDACVAVGMWRGRPPAYTFEPHYRDVLEAVRKNIGRGAVAVELALLRVVRSNGDDHENDWRA